MAHRNRGQLEPTGNALSRDNGPSHYVKKRKVRTRHVVLRSLLIAFVAIIACGGLAFAKFYNDINSKITRNISPELASELSDKKEVTEPFYMLLLGVDKNKDRAADWGDEESNFRSDTIILARVDPKALKVTLVSIARDTLVDMGSNGKQKINAAYSYGGPSYAVKVVEQYAGVDISHYAEVDFDALVNIVNGIGGIQVNVLTDVVDPEAAANIHAGEQTLDGAQALALCRSRHAYDAYGAGDFYRAANQRMVIAAIIQKVLSSDPLTIANTINNLADGVTTDLDASQLISLALQMRNINVSKDVYSGMNPTYGQMINGISYQVTDEPAWHEMMKRVEAGETPYASTADDPTYGVAGTPGDAAYGGNSSDTIDSVKPDRTGSVEVLNGSGANGAAARAAAKLAEDGFTTTTGPADSTDYQGITVVYRGDANLAKAKGVGEALSSLGSVNYVRDSSNAYRYSSDVLVIVGR